MKKVIVTIGILTLALGLWVGQNSQAAHSDRHCNGCHVPHWAVPESASDYGVPLWSPTNTKDGLKYTYTMYSSKGFEASGAKATQSAQPDGPSKLCLGCHDGSYAYIATHMDPGHANYDPDYKAAFGAEDLTRSHPISFVYDQALATNSGGRLHDPTTTNAGLGDTRSISAALLDSKEKMQCTSCHDVHGDNHAMLRIPWNATGLDEDGNSVPKNDNVLCRTCHNK